MPDNGLESNAVRRGFESRAAKVSWLLALMFVLSTAGCVSVPAWVRAPVQGRLVDQDSGAPVLGGTIATPDGELLGVSESSGTFRIPAKRGKATIFLLGANDIFERTSLIFTAPGYEPLQHTLPLGRVSRGDHEPRARDAGELKMKKASETR